MERGTWAESKRVKEPRRAALPHKTHSPGFYGNGFSFQVVSGQSLTQGPSWWCTHRPVKMESSEKDSGRLVGHMDWRLLSAFALSQILPVDGSLLVPHSLPGPPV